MVQFVVAIGQVYHTHAGGVWETATRLELLALREGWNKTAVRRTIETSSWSAVPRAGGPVVGCARRIARRGRRPRKHDLYYR